MKQLQIFIAMLLFMLCVFGCGSTDNPVDVNETDIHTGILQVEVEKIDGVSIYLRLIKDEQLVSLSFSSGSFEIDEIAAGEYTLQISAEGYETIEKDVTIVSGETVSLDKVSLTKLTDSLEPGEGLQIGSKAPDFELPGGNGDTYSLSDYLGENKKVVIVFYRTGG